MALPSQSARPTDRRHHMYRRKRSPLGTLALIGAGAVVVIVWAVFAFSSGSDEEAGNGGSVPIAQNQPAGTSNVSPPPNNPPANPGNTTSPRLTDPTRPLDSGGQSISNPNLLGGNPQTNPPAPPSGGGTSSSRPNDTDRTPGNTAPPPASPNPGDERATQPPSFAELKRARDQFALGMSLLQTDPVRAREHLTGAYISGLLPREDERRIRVNLTTLNEELVFGTKILPDDPFVQRYTVQPNDVLSTIARRRSLMIDWRLIQRVNGIRNANSIQSGQNLKLVTGPFHLIIHKSEYRADLFLGDGEQRVYVRSFDVGLGESDKTPIGTFRVRPNSKLINPEWINPVTRERFAADDPKNPIGEHWIGLEGVDDLTRDKEGYGIHGTIEPNSIGRQMSMGCIRMRAEDVALVYELLIENASVIEIRR